MDRGGSLGQQAGRHAAAGPVDGLEGRHLGLAAGDPLGAAGVEGAAGRRVERAGRLARPGGRGPCRAAARRPAGPWCRDAAAPRTTSSAGPSSTISPRYMTAMRSAMNRAAAQVVGHEHDSHPQLPPQHLEEVQHRRRRARRRARTSARRRAAAWAARWSPGRTPPAGAGHPRGCRPSPAATSGGRPTRREGLAPLGRPARCRVGGSGAGARRRSPRRSSTASATRPASWNTICGRSSASDHGARRRP